jgi:hypothetical protein
LVCKPEDWPILTIFSKHKFLLLLLLLFFYHVLYFPSTISYLFLLFPFLGVGKYWDLNLGFMLAKQVLYSLSQHFYSSYFGDRVSLFAQASLGCDPPIFHFPSLLG